MEDETTNWVVVVARRRRSLATGPATGPPTPCGDDSFLPIGPAQWRDVIKGLSVNRLERAIGVIYRPDTEFQSHYFASV